MSQLVINSQQTLDSAIADISSQWSAHKYLRIQVKTGKDRSLKQNNFTHAWYEEIARAFPEDDARGWKRFCKLHLGVPILRSEDEDFREKYDQSIKKLKYENKLIAMDIMPVTSIMTKAQLTKYADDVQAHFKKQGLILEVKETN